MYEINRFYVGGKASKEDARQTNKRLLIVAERQRGVRTKGKRPEREGAWALGGWEKARFKEPLRSFGLTPVGMLVDGFRDPEAAFAAAEGLKRCETVGLWHGPGKAQGAAAAGASGIDEGNVVRRLHRRCA